MAHALGETDADDDRRTDEQDLTEEQRAVDDVLPQPGIAFRGGFGALARTEYEVGRTYRHTGVLRASRDARIATDNFADQDIVVLFGRDSRDLSAFAESPEEAETVFSPDPTFTVVAQRQIQARQDARLAQDGLDGVTDRDADQRDDARLADEPFLTVVVVHGRKDDPPTPVEDAVQRAVHAIAGVREVGPAELTTAGRFRGPIGTGEDGRLQTVSG